MKINDVKVGAKVRELEFNEVGVVERLDHENNTAFIRITLKNGATDLLEMDVSELEPVKG